MRRCPFTPRRTPGVEVVDSAYSGVPFLGKVAPHDNLVTIARMRGSRTLYRQPKPQEGAPPVGHPTPAYAGAFRLLDDTTWGTPDEEVKAVWITRKGRRLIVTLHAWHDMLMSGTRRPRRTPGSDASLPLHPHPMHCDR